MSAAVRQATYVLDTAASVLLAMILFHSPSGDAAGSATVVTSGYSTTGKTTITCPAGWKGDVRQSNGHGGSGTLHVVCAP